MKHLILTCIRRPVAVTMALAALLLAGGIALSVLPVDSLPELQVPRVQISARYPGLAARDIRSVLTIPIEDALASVRSLQRIRSVSRDGETVIVLDFAWGTDPEEASVLVREAVDGVYPQLPEGIQRPVVLPGDSEGEPLAIIGIRSRTEEAQFARHVAEYELRSRFRRIGDIGTVLLVGGQKQEVRIQLDAQRSFPRGLGAAGFAELVGSEWADVSAGSAREGDQELVIVSAGRPTQLDELARRILPARSGPVYPAELGQVSLEYRDRESLFVADGREAVALELYRRPRSNPLSVARQVRQTLEEAQRDLGRDVDLFLVYDGSESTRRGLLSLGRSALFGALAVVLALFFFIRSARGSLLTLLSLPVSAAASCAALALAGKSLNSMSLGGLALGIGLVSDTSVIILELMERYFGPGSHPGAVMPADSAVVSPVGAAQVGAAQAGAAQDRPLRPQAEALAELVASVAASSLGSTLTTVIVFVPILFLPGPLGQLFADLSITLVAAVAAGWAYAQFALPSLYRLWWRPSQAKPHPPVLARLVSIYRRLLRYSFRHPFQVLVTASMAVLMGTALLVSRPARFTPTEGAEQLELQLAFAPGTRLDEMVKHGEALSRLAKTLPAVDTVFGRSGAEAEDILHRASPDYRRELLTLRCILKRGASAGDTMVALEKTVQTYLAAEGPAELGVRIAYPRDRIEGVLGLSSAYTLVLKGENPETLQASLERTLSELEKRNPGSQFTSRPSGERPELTIRLKRDMAATAQISAMAVARTLQASTEGLAASRMELEGRPIDIRIMAQLDETHPLADLEQLPVNEGGTAPIYLGSIASLERNRGPAAVARLDRSDVAYIDGTPAPGKAKQLAQSLQTASTELAGLSYSDESAFSQYQKSLLFTVLLVILLLYFYLAAQFESYGIPVLLMVGILFSLSGAGPALVLVGAGLDSGSVIGLVVLFGLAVNNAIILYEVSQERIEGGAPRLFAVYRGAAERLIPVLTTTATTLLALLPVIISPMEATQRSMSAAMFGGVAASTLFTLLAIPPLLVRFMPAFKENPQGGIHAFR